jgi:hypothetical protein
MSRSAACTRTSPERIVATGHCGTAPRRFRFAVPTTRCAPGSVHDVPRRYASDQCTLSTSRCSGAPTRQVSLAVRCSWVSDQRAVRPVRARRGAGERAPRAFTARSPRRSTSLSARLGCMTVLGGSTRWWANSCTSPRVGSLHFATTATPWEGLSQQRHRDVQSDQSDVQGVAAGSKWPRREDGNRRPARQDCCAVGRHDPQGPPVPQHERDGQSATDPSGGQARDREGSPATAVSTSPAVSGTPKASGGQIRNAGESTGAIVFRRSTQQQGSRLVVARLWGSSADLDR